MKILISKKNAAQIEAFFKKNKWKIEKLFPDLVAEDIETKKKKKKKKY